MALPPTEINQEMLNKLLAKFGVSSCKYVDILGLEPDYLKTFSNPVRAVVLTFPLTTKLEEFRNKKAEEQKGKNLNSEVFYLKQTLENSSGLVALIHTVASNKDFVSFSDDYSLKSYIEKINIEKSAAGSSEERGKLLEKNEALLSDFKSVAAEGFVRPDGGDQCHVLVLVPANKPLTEIDGHLDRPIDHGPLSESFLENAVHICKQYTEQAKDEVRFSAVALVKDA
ncbi:ubiquitin carboxyl-terminal hydrolase isozyme L1-like [Lithobates pipiens]